MRGCLERDGGADVSALRCYLGGEKAVAVDEALPPILGPTKSARGYGTGAVDIWKAIRPRWTRGFFSSLVIEVVLLPRARPLCFPSVDDASCQMISREVRVRPAAL